MDKLKEKYSNDWIEHIIKNINNYEIDICDILQNKLLTEEVYNHLKIRIENEKHPILDDQEHVVYIKYKDGAEILTHMWCCAVKEDLDKLLIFNPNFGEKYLIKYLDSFDKHKFISLFTACDPMYESLGWWEMLFENINLTPCIIKHYFTKHNINPIEDIGYTYFWNVYSRRDIPLEELDLSWPWKWAQIIMYNLNITLEFIEENKEFILNTDEFERIILINKKMNQNIIVNNLFEFLILINETFSWEIKDKILKSNKWNGLCGGLGTSKSSCMINISDTISKTVKFPKEVYTEIITNRENSKYLKLYNINLHFIPQCKYLDVEHIEYLYENIDKFHYLVHHEIDEDDELKLFCNYPNITIELLEKYHTKYIFDLEYNPFISWYHYSKYPHLFQNMCFKKIIQYTKNSELEYICDNLHYINQIIKIQRWWLHKIYYNPEHRVCQNRLNAQYDSYT
jgi:hypothetical protein